MSFALATYNDGARMRDTQITIKKASNGFIFSLRGEKENLKRKSQFDDRWETFNADFVFTSLEDGLKEVDGFFKLIEKNLQPKKTIIKKSTKK